MRALNFAKRNFKEIVRDPLSIIFFILDTSWLSVIRKGYLYVVVSLGQNSIKIKWNWFAGINPYFLATLKILEGSGDIE